MTYYPIAVDLKDKNVLVVGGGTVALRKIETLLDFGAHVTVVSPCVTQDIFELTDSGRVILCERCYESSDVGKCALVIAATNDKEVNLQVSADAQTAGVPVNVVDDPELCSFIVQSVVRRGDLVISIGTGGNSPALAKRVREKIEEVIGPEYAELTELMGELREAAKSKISSQSEREKLFDKVLDSDVPELIRQGKREEAQKLAFFMLLSF
ncbi:MAG: bifunctional precorrin-2 dehydrogenase/sirohydrochlorin ferrochelatase [Armatimonadota bacterium]